MENNKLVQKKSVKNMGLLFSGSLTSKLGDIIFDYTNSVWIAGLGANSPKIMAFYQASQSVMGVLFNLIGGYFSDLSDRKKLLVLTDFFSALVCFLASFFLPTPIALYFVLGTNIALAFFYSFNSPAYRAFAREIMVDEHIGRYNSLVSSFLELAGIIGPALALVLMEHLSIRQLYWINAATFLSSAMLELGITVLFPKKETLKKEGFCEVFQGIREGFSYVRKRRELFDIVLLASCSNFFLSGYNLLMPYTSEITGIKGFYGHALVAGAVGGILGAFLMNKADYKKMKLGFKMALNLGMTGVAMIFFFVSRNLFETEFFYLVPLFILGMFITMFNISVMTSVQLSVESEFLGRVFSIMFTVSLLFMPVGSAFFSYVFDVYRILNFLILGLGIVSLSVMYFGKQYIRQRKIEKH